MSIEHPQSPEPESRWEVLASGTEMQSLVLKRKVGGEEKMVFAMNIHDKNPKYPGLYVQLMGSTQPLAPRYLYEAAQEVIKLMDYHKTDRIYAQVHHERLKKLLDSAGASTEEAEMDENTGRRGTPITIVSRQQLELIKAKLATIANF